MLVVNFFLLFIIYSVLGWAIETIVTCIINKKFVDRGFLIGPYLPIYGTGALAIIVLLKPYYNDYVALFVMCVIICSIIEYLSSYFMEKIFKARWWDYTHIPFNINGRICLCFSIAFGFMGTIIILVNKYLYKFLISIPPIINIILFIILILIFITDIIISFNIINKIKLSADNLRKDYSEEITSKVKEILKNKSLLVNRLLNAYPDIKIIKKKK